MIPGFPIPAVDDRAIYDLRQARMVPRVVTVGQSVGLYEHLERGPATIEAIAGHFGVVGRAAEALVAVSAAAGFLARDDAGRFGLTELGRTYLVPSSPFHFELAHPSDAEACAALERAFRRGDDEDPGGRLAVDMATHDDETIRGFIDTMHRITLPAAGGLARQPVFDDVRRLLDVGGGSGSLAIAIADANPHLTCTILDLAPVCAIAEENIKAYGRQERVRTVTADMLNDRWPGDQDAVLFGNIFHDWDVATCHELARRAHDALVPGGHILLHEMPLDETRDGPLTVACFSVSMLLAERGKQYTRTELEGMLTHAGFTGFETRPSYGYYHLVSARRPA